MLEQSTRDSIGLNVPFNHDPLTLDALAAINADPLTRFPVRQIYFSESSSLTGNGRLSRSLPKRCMSLPEICAVAHREAIEVFLVWNAPSLGGSEWTREFRARMIAEIERIVKAGVDGIILTLPILSNCIREIAPSLSQSVSVNARIDSVSMLGEVICLWAADRYYIHPSRSRSFSLIRSMKKAHPESHLVALVNESCILNCPLQPFHQDYLAQTTRLGADLDGIDYHHVLCGIHKLSDDLHVLRSPWVSPEGIRHLFEAGVSRVKLAGRTLDTASLLQLIRAYAHGSYDGDIWPFFEKSGLTSPEWDELLGKPMSPCRYRVENHLLVEREFMEYFAKANPPCVDGLPCGGCTHCHNALIAVTPPTNKLERIADLKTVKKAVENRFYRVSRPEASAGSMGG